MAKEQKHSRWTKERVKVFFEKDLPIGVTIACFVAFCAVMCIDDDSKPTSNTGAVQSYSYKVRPSDQESTSTITRRRVTPAQSKENEMIDKLSREDFYDESDYYDGLDGEYNDIDYNDVIDYFAD